MQTSADMEDIHKMTTYKRTKVEIVLMVPKIIDGKLGVSIPVGLESVILAFTAFCFSMTTGVIWEFFEFSMDWFFGMDMQKNRIRMLSNPPAIRPHDRPGGNCL